MSFWDDKIYEVAIIGAGAAGLMAAIQCSHLGLKVLLLDGKEKIGAKILMSGGTRCNVTNRIVLEKDFETENRRVLRNVLSGFPAPKAVKFFEELGIKLVLEEGGKYFPSTHSGRTVLEALLREVKRSGVQLDVPRKVKSVQFRSRLFSISGEEFSYHSKTVILATGGLSYPGTGSDGVGYSIAKSFGHHLIETTPSLTPFESDDSDWKILSGFSLAVRLKLLTQGKKEIACKDDFLFTHFGFSGPASLNMSRHWLRAPKNHEVKLTANFLPAEGESEFREKLIKEREREPNRTLKRFLSEKLPSRFIEVLLKKIEIPESRVLNQLKRDERQKLLAALFHFPLKVTGVVGYQKAEATAGGIDLKELDSSTLESKLQSGLFLAGEMLDVDGRIGGFNFQWAWSSAVTAARGVAKKLQTD
ncbi:MAG: NAD(P)/FAD-dependent oxidoreductase [Candidatus Omnitrophica bacterium]|nr:NAD(P)/FAD-dependent oxidoreductase [Candidatus Omnitrophota bacterium]